MYEDKLGLGFVPSYVYNAQPFCKDLQYSLVWGSYMQYYISEFWSLIIEYSPTLSGWRQTYNTVSLGIELETGGHFFKLFFTNQDKINMTQYLTGSDLTFNGNNLRFGFLISRIL
ncbi:MAG: DUF5777 family beta-barrel protein [candidate division KSB1 bacterium]|nr:DUF5777 family beta-barrel protein [candidate division KSB1 bacterium]